MEGSYYTEEEARLRKEVSSMREFLNEVIEKHERKCEQVRRFSEALAAAEAECAAARTALSPPPLQMAGPTDSIVLQPSPARQWADLRQAANANDATRARLGLGRIGEAR
jgi:hypothetical protein